MDYGSWGTVYLALDYGYDDLTVDGHLHPRWISHRVSGREPGPELEESPQFADASDAVRWWRSRGAERIWIRLDDTEVLWAGVGDPPVDGDDRASVFSDDDPRCRPEGALATAVRQRDWDRKRMEADLSQIAVEEGARLRQRREAIELSIEDLAERVNVDSSWIRDVESGRTAGDVRMSQWLSLVWATREPWPDDRKNRSHKKVGYVGSSLAGAEDIVRQWLKDP